MSDAEIIKRGINTESNTVDLEKINIRLGSKLIVQVLMCIGSLVWFTILGTRWVTHFEQAMIQSDINTNRRVDSLFVDRSYQFKGMSERQDRLEADIDTVRKDFYEFLHLQNFSYKHRIK